LFWFFIPAPPPSQPASRPVIPPSEPPARPVTPPEPRAETPPPEPEPEPEEAPQAPAGGAGQYRALYDYAAADDDEVWLHF